MVIVTRCLCSPSRTGVQRLPGKGCLGLHQRNELYRLAMVQREIMHGHRIRACSICLFVGMCAVFGCLFFVCLCVWIHIKVQIRLSWKLYIYFFILMRFFFLSFQVSCSSACSKHSGKGTHKRPPAEQLSLKFTEQFVCKKVLFLYYIRLFFFSFKHYGQKAFSMLI